MSEFVQSFLAKAGEIRNLGMTILGAYQSAQRSEAQTSARFALEALDRLRAEGAALDCLPKPPPGAACPAGWRDWPSWEWNLRRAIEELWKVCHELIEQCMTSMRGLEKHDVNADPIAFTNAQTAAHQARLHCEKVIGDTWNRLWRFGEDIRLFSMLPPQPPAHVDQPSKLDRLGCEKTTKRSKKRVTREEANGIMMKAMEDNYERMKWGVREWARLINGTVGGYANVSTSTIHKTEMWKQCDLVRKKAKQQRMTGNRGRRKPRHRSNA
jgi:hypothetical protein